LRDGESAPDASSFRAAAPSPPTTAPGV
jgi:hypothetical protein